MEPLQFPTKFRSPSSGGTVDLSLVLSVIHWFDDPAAVLRALAATSKQLIIEIPDKADINACGQGFIQSIGEPTSWCEFTTGFPCKTIGRVTRHTSDARSHVILINNTALDPQTTKSSPLLNLMSLGRLRWPNVAYWLRASKQVSIQSRIPLRLFQNNISWTGNGISLAGSASSGTMIWQVGGTSPVWSKGRQQLIRAVDLHYELRLLKRALSAWNNNETTDPSGAVGRVRTAEQE